MLSEVSAKILITRYNSEIVPKLSRILSRALNESCFRVTMGIAHHSWSSLPFLAPIRTEIKVVHESHVNAIVYDSRNGRLYSGDGVGAVVVWRRASGGRGGVDDYSVLRKAKISFLSATARDIYHSLRASTSAEVQFV